MEIEEYILLSLFARQQHLKLTEPCCERGCPKNNKGLSTWCKGLMAHILGTTIPTSHKIYVCHACNNPSCSNPNHLYWGTAKENTADRTAVDNRTAWDYTVAKYGYAEAVRLASQRSNKDACAKGGRAGKGKPKSEEQKKKIAESMLGKCNAKKSTAS